MLLLHVVFLLAGFVLSEFTEKVLRQKPLDVDIELSVNAGKRGQLNDQVVELPIEHQIYDMIDAEGSRGLTVIEVFFFRSWASVRVMSLMRAELRAGLLKRVVKDDPNKKLSRKECEKIAKDLNLTLQQVLRVYYDKQQQRLNRFEGVYAEGNGAQPLKSKRSSSSQKRKRVSGEKSLINIDSLAGKFSENRPANSIKAGNHFTEEHHIITSSGEPDIDLHAVLEDDHLENVEEHGPSEEDDNYYFISSQG